MAYHESQSNGFAFAPAISGNGRHIVFQSLASNLVPGDTNARSDLFVFDRVQQSLEKLNISFPLGSQTANVATVQECFRSAIHLHPAENVLLPSWPAISILIKIWMLRSPIKGLPPSAFRCETMVGLMRVGMIGLRFKLFKSK